MKKKAVAILLLFIVTFSLTSCSKNSKDFKSIKDAQTALLNAQSAKIVATSVQSTSDGTSEKYTLEATYMVASDGLIKYCATQTDSGGKVVSVEYNDGNVFDRWIIGMGWKSVDPISEDFVTFSRKKPFPLLEIMTQPIDEKEIDKISRASTDSITSYSLSLNIQKQKDDMKADGFQEAEFTQLLESSKNILVDANKIMCGSTDTVKVKDTESGSETTSVITTSVSEVNNIKEVVKPQMPN
ncbi:MAG: hypothetical protein RR497_01940 [Oscillospiraceae bacterium]